MCSSLEKHNNDVHESLSFVLLFISFFKHFLIKCIVFISLNSTHKLTEFSFQMENLHYNDFIIAPDMCRLFAVTIYYSPSTLLLISLILIDGVI